MRTYCWPAALLAAALAAGCGGVSPTLKTVPVSAAANNTFGVVSTQINDPRLIQFGLRLFY